MVNMRRKTASEKVAKLRWSRLQKATLDLRRRCLRWSTDSMEGLLAQPEPVSPKGLDGRDDDAWEVLLVIADYAGGMWPDVARQAAVALTQTRQQDDGGTLATELLQDIREVFRIYKQDRLKVTEMVLHLRVLEGAPWDDLDRNGLTPHKLGRLLKNYGIRSKPIRFKAGMRPASR